MAPIISKESPKHPLFKALRLHAAVRSVLEDPDQKIPPSCWQGLVIIAFGTHSDRGIRDNDNMMKRLFLIEKAQDGVVTLPDDSVARASLAVA